VCACVRERVQVNKREPKSWLNVCAVMYGVFVQAPALHYLKQVVG